MLKFELFLFSVKIIDDFGIPLSSSDPGSKSKKKKDEDEEEDETDAKYATLEEQPQIAGFVDDRPEIEIMKEKFTTSSFQPLIKIEDEEDDDKSKIQKFEPSSSSSKEAVKVSWFKKKIFYTRFTVALPFKFTNQLFLCIASYF